MAFRYIWLGMEYQKVKSVAKQIVTSSDRLDNKILSTLKLMSDIVGCTLGPGGRPVLIERYEGGLPSMVTKDGVTVARSLGMDDPSEHCIMEAARDAAIRTAGEAGDGTTTATVLAYAIVRETMKFRKDNPHVSPQRIVRRLEQVFKETIQPLIEKESMVCKNLKPKKRKHVLKSVATVSANGDTQLADAVMECYDVVGDEGNVTITEYSGEQKYEVERIEGYPIGMGYEESCAKYYSKFINDPATQRCVLENPVFILYHGKITEMQTVVNLLIKIGTDWGTGDYHHHNVVLVATGFSESVLGQLALNFAEATTINVFPLLAPLSAAAGGQGQLHFLQDLSAITGAEIFDPMNAPLDGAELRDLGPGVKTFECNRTRSNVIGHAMGNVVDPDGALVAYTDPETLEERPLTYEDLLMEHLSNLDTQMENPESELDFRLLQERKGKCSGGIARLKVIGASNGELKEKRDRAEDAVCAVRGAIKFGCLPGGGWMLSRIQGVLVDLYVDDQIVMGVLVPALEEPIKKILENLGMHEKESHEIIVKLFEFAAQDEITVYDALQHKFVNAVEGGILDSTPAVLEAVRNSISIASLLGTLGGTVCFRRDVDLERKEAVETADFLRNANVNEANERP
jgi:chaperonin GroEL